jgi:hypothetical protein
VILLAVAVRVCWLFLAGIGGGRDIGGGRSKSGFLLEAAGIFDGDGKVTAAALPLRVSTDFMGVSVGAVEEELPPSSTSKIELVGAEDESPLLRLPVNEDDEDDATADDSGG